MIKTLRQKLTKTKHLSKRKKNVIETPAMEYAPAEVDIYFILLWVESIV